MKTRRRAVALLLTCVLVTLAVNGVDATPPWRFGDQDVLSPNGRFRFTATWWDEPGVRWPFGDHRLTHALVDTQTGVTLWTRTSQLPGGLLFVGDNGASVILNLDNLIIVEPVTGEQILSVSIDDQLTEEESKDYSHWTTAGAVWNEAPLAGFYQHDGRSLFMLWMWWGRSIIVDLERAAFVEQPGPALLSAGVRQLVLTTLDSASEESLPEQMNFYGGGERARVLAAVRAAGLTVVREAVPHLRLLERSDDLVLRTTVHVALRRLGETPLVFPCNWPEWHEEYACFTEPRADRVDMVRVGDEPAAVRSAIGCPDSVAEQNLIWEYDMDAVEPYTLRIRWSVGRVEQIERIKPALWQQGFARDRELLRRR